MTPAILFWLLPGYVVHLFHKMIRSVRNSSGWDFVALSGLYATLLYLLCVVTKLLVLRFIPFAPALGKWLSNNLGLPPECRLLPLACVYAVAWGVLATRHKRFARWIWRRWPGDPYIEFTRHSVESARHVIVTLKSGKVYVGVLAGATFDVNEAARSVALAIELSGYRKSGTHQVVFDKNYLSYGISSRSRTLLLPYSEIAMISPFSYELHEKFVLNGVTLLEPAGAGADPAASHDDNIFEPREDAHPSH